MSQRRNEFDIYKVIVALGFFGVTAVSSGLRRMRRARQVQDTGTSLVRSAPQGFVELQGYAWPIRVEPSLVDDSQCVYFDLAVEHLRKSGKHSSWTEIYTEWSPHPFFLADDTGYALIYPKGGSLEVSSRTISWRELSPSAKQAIKERAALVSVEIKDQSIFEEKYRVREKRVLPGSPLYALGSFRTIREPGREEPRPLNGLTLFLQTVRFWQRNPMRAQQALDADRDGRISFEEWYAGLSQQALVSGGRFTEAPVVLPRGLQNSQRCAGVMRHESGSPLYMADCHQEQLIERLSSGNIARIIGGAILLAFSSVLFYLRWTGRIR